MLCITRILQLLHNNTPSIIGGADWWGDLHVTLGYDFKPTLRLHRGPRVVIRKASFARDEELAG